MGGGCACRGPLTRPCLWETRLPTDRWPGTGQVCAQRCGAGRGGPGPGELCWPPASLPCGEVPRKEDYNPQHDPGDRP